MPAALSGRTLVKAALFSLASNAAVLFVIKFGVWLWPEGLPSNSQNVFWLASGVNVAGLLLLGLGYWPVILLDAFPAWLLAGQPLDLTLLGSFTNAMEALLAAWIICRLGFFRGSLDQPGAVAYLLGASIVAPLINTLVIPAWFCVRGLMPWSQYPHALANWNLANGAAMLLVLPVLLVPARPVFWRGQLGEKLGLFLVAAALCFASFDALFSGVGMNYVFVIFPVVIYAAVRFGPAELALVLGLVLVSVYGALAMHSHALPPDQMASQLWFVQAFCWVLAATGLLVAALVAAARRATQAAADEHERTLDLALHADRARLAALRYQINPHFLFNSLNSVRATLSLADTVPREMLTELATYLRSALSHPDRDLATLGEEIGFAERYLSIEKKRFGENLRTTVEFPPGLAQRSIPVFLLQPLVENAIRHGFETSQGVFDLQIHAHEEGGRLVIGVKNSGAWSASPTQSSLGLGLANIRERLRLLYADEATLEILSQDGWVEVRITLPAHSHPA